MLSLVHGTKVSGPAAVYGGVRDTATGGHTMKRIATSKLAAQPERSPRRSAQLRGKATQADRVRASLLLRPPAGRG